MCAAQRKQSSVFSVAVTYPPAYTAYDETLPAPGSCTGTKSGPSHEFATARIRAGLFSFLRSGLVLTEKLIDELTDHLLFHMHIKAEHADKCELAEDLRLFFVLDIGKGIA